MSNTHLRIKGSLENVMEKYEVNHKHHLLESYFVPLTTVCDTSCLILLNLKKNMIFLLRP